MAQHLKYGRYTLLKPTVATRQAVKTLHMQDQHTDTDTDKTQTHENTDTQPMSGGRRQI
jgi:hypothetical protein